MDIGDARSESVRSNQPVEQRSKVTSTLADKITRVGDHCLHSLKLLETHEEHLLTGSVPNRDDLEIISGEISVLKGIVTEHKGEVGNDKQAAQLLSLVEKRLEALESKYNNLKSGNGG